MSNTIPTDQEWKEHLAGIDRQRAELATWKKAHIELGEMYDLLRAENAELWEAVRIYGVHRLACSAKSWEDKNCNCGFIEFLAKTAKEEK